jgi:DNA-binding transcriptional ArsR family regulator
MDHRSHKLFVMYDAPGRHQLVAHFSALANPTRLRIVERLAEDGAEVTVSDLAASLRMSQPRMSWHLALLRRGGVVRQRKEGRVVHCSLDLDNVRRNQSALWALLTEHRRIGVNV